MTEAYEELLHIADHLDQLAERGDDPAIQEPLNRLERAANEIGKAWSGSWLGYHSKVYYADLERPPPGVHFSQEWGLGGAPYSNRVRTDWREFDGELVEAAIHERAGNPDLELSRKFNNSARSEFDEQKRNVLSVLEIATTDSSDSYLNRLKDQASRLKVLSQFEVTDHFRPKSKSLTRDRLALLQGQLVPPHISVLSEIVSINGTITVVQELAKIGRQAGAHLLRLQRRRQKTEIIGTNVFIGHGRSPIWRELKEFIQDRLRLPVDEFNRVPVAGVTNIARLSEMLDAAAIAFLIMTGEDEHTDGKSHARMNVIHEAGLFQGRLGFTRAIVLLEEGCETFSNIEGLGQIRFPKGNIRAAFEQIREVLEREKLL